MYSVEYIPDAFFSANNFLIGIIGLNIGKNVTHTNLYKSLMEHASISNSRLKYRFIEFSSIKKFKRTDKNYNSYSDGILSFKWTKNIQSEKPQLYVIFFDFDADDVKWVEKATAYSQAYLSISYNLAESDSKLLFVLLETNNPPIIGEETGKRIEKLTYLCQLCNISYNNLLLLPVIDDKTKLEGHISRLEYVFKENLLEYVNTQIKRYKSYNETHDSSNQQAFIVRHSFKIAFFYELKGDKCSALKFYKNAYSSLLNIKLTDENHLEIKAISGIVCYKVCRILIEQNYITDAFNFFRNHTFIYKNNRFNYNSYYQHLAWLIKQLILFAGLLEYAINFLDFKPKRSFNPGIFYLWASKLSIERRNSLSNKLHIVLKNQFIIDDMRSKYIGQADLYHDYVSNNICNTSYGTIEEYEHNICHTDIIKGTLNKAIENFSIVNSTNFIAESLILLSEQYDINNDHLESFKLILSSLEIYKHCLWPENFVKIISKLISCAILNSRIDVLISYSITIIHKEFVSFTDQKPYLNFLKSFLLGEFDYPLNLISPNYIHENDVEKWNHYINSILKTKSSYVIQIDDHFNSYFQHSISVDNYSMKIDEDFPFKLSINILLDNHLVLHKIIIRCSIKLNQEENLVDIPIDFTSPIPFTKGKHSFDTHFPSYYMKPHAQIKVHELEYFTTLTYYDCEFIFIIKNIESNSFVVLDKIPQICFSLNWENNFIVGGIYNLNFSMINNETKAIHDVRIKISTTNNNSFISSQHAKIGYNYKEIFNNELNYKFDVIESNGQMLCDLFANFPSIESVEFIFEIFYKYNSTNYEAFSNPIECYKIWQEDFSSREAFSVSMDFLDENLQLTKYLIVNRPYFLTCSLQSVYCNDLNLINIRYSYNQRDILNLQNFNDLIIPRGHVIQDLCPLSLKNMFDQSIMIDSNDRQSIGQIIIEYTNDKSSIDCTTKLFQPIIFSLPIIPIQIINLPIDWTFDIPKNLLKDIPFDISIKFINLHQHFNMEVILVIEDSSHDFFISGKIKSIVNINMNETSSIVLNLTANKIGCLQLPKIKSMIVQYMSQQSSSHSNLNESHNFTDYIASSFCKSVFVQDN